MEAIFLAQVLLLLLAMPVDVRNPVTLSVSKGFGAQLQHVAALRPQQLALPRQTAKRGPPSCRSRDTIMEPMSMTSWMTSLITMTQR